MGTCKVLGYVCGYVYVCVYVYLLSIMRSIEYEALVRSMIVCDVLFYQTYMEMHVICILSSLSLYMFTINYTQILVNETRTPTKYYELT